MHNRSFAIAMLLCLTILFTSAVAFAAETAPFADVKETDWFYDEVQYVYNYGLMSGISATDFAPALATTRGMIVTILYRIEGQPAVIGSCPFADVVTGAYYELAITWAAANGIVSGYSTQEFSADAEITREQMAAILSRYANYKGYVAAAAKDLTAYADYGKISSYALSAMAWANAEGLISGTSAVTLSPQGTATRAQAAAILSRFHSQFIARETAGASYTVSFLLNEAEGSNAVYQSQSVVAGSMVGALIDPIREGYLFAGWYLAPEDSPLFDFNTIIQQNMTVYAHWTAITAEPPIVPGQPLDPAKPTAPTDTLPSGSLPSDSVTNSHDNIFKIDTVLSEDGKSLDLTLSLTGSVKLCGFDVALAYNNSLFQLSSLDTQHDLQLFANRNEAAGLITFNYAGANNIKKQKTIMTATYDVVGPVAAQGIFSLLATEIIQTDESNDYNVVAAPYTFTYQIVELK